MGTIKCCSSVMILDVHSISDKVVMLCCGSCDVQSSLALNAPCPAGPGGMEEKTFPVYSLL